MSNVTNMDYMFCGAESFVGDISKWDVGNVTDMGSMFHNASSFNGDISKLEIGAKTGIGGMFDNCPIEHDKKPATILIRLVPY